MSKLTPLPVASRLTQILATIERPVAFATSGNREPNSPGLEVHDLGPISLPLTVVEAKKLKSHCEQAPYGLGEKTLVDRNVRRVWRMKSDRFRLTNPDWTRWLEGILREVQTGLGLSEPLQAHLHDLLLYEKGSFFLPHRDSEKLPRMVATLVLVLPSKHEGGELVIRHEGKEEVIQTGGARSKTHLQFAAFYADCEHEVRPLNSGYRLCLTYNLTLAQSSNVIGAPRNESQIAEVAELLRIYFQTASNTRCVFALGHQYTKEGLLWDALKGVDAAKASVLAEAGRRIGCRAYLAQCEFYEMGMGQEAYQRSPSRSRRRWSEEEEEEEDGEESSSNTSYEMVEVYESDLSLDHWSSPEGNRPPFGELSIEEREVLNSQVLRSVKPDEEFEGYTGNEGETLDRWYRQAAVVLWPERNELDILATGKTREKVFTLICMVQTWQAASGENAAKLKQNCLDLATRIFATWTPYESEIAAPDRTDPDPLAALIPLGEPRLIRTYLTSAFAKDDKLKPEPTIVEALDTWGWATFRDELVELMRMVGSTTLSRNTRLLELLCKSSVAKGRPRAASAEAKATCQLLAETAVEAFENLKLNEDSWEPKRFFPRNLDRLVSLINALLEIDEPALVNRAIRHAFALPQIYPLREVHLPAIETVAASLTGKQASRAAFLEWVQQCEGELETLTAVEPQPPKDFRRDSSTVKCKCTDCVDLKKFLESPLVEEFLLTAVAGRREHLERTLRYEEKDLDYMTIRKGSPHTLRCRKTQRGYQRVLQQYRIDLVSLTRLRELAMKLKK